MMNTLERFLDTNHLLKTIAGLADQMHAEDLEILHVTELCSFADYFVLMTGRSKVQNQAIAEKMIYTCKHAGNRPDSIEGLEKGDWILLDFGAVIVHIFKKESRDFYRIEQLWAEAPKIEVALDSASGDKTAVDPLSGAANGSGEA